MKKLTIILTTLLLIHPGAFSQSTDLHKLLPEASELDNVADYKDPERGESYHLEIYEMSDLYAAYGINFLRKLGSISYTGAR